MTDWAGAVAEWKAWCRTAGHSEGTIMQRGVCLRVFAGAAGEEPWSVTLADCVRFLGRPGWAPETRRLYRGALRSFFTFACDLGYVTDDPTARLPRVRVPEAPPRPAPDAVLEQALERASDRDRLVVMLAAYAGLRRAEIAGLRWADVGDGALRVRGKGGRVRMVPLHPELAGELAAERARRDAGGAGTGYRYTAGLQGAYVFPGQCGGPITPGAVGNAAVRVLRGWGAHSLRHRFATRAYAAERDLLAVQTLLGHAKPETTRRYAALPPGALERAVLAAGA